MKKNLSLLVMLFCIAAALVITAEEEKPVLAVSAGIKEGTIIVIDAGHGGMDGGAVGYDGIPEKKYNLELAMALDSFFRAAGYETLLTRTDDGDTDGSEGFDKRRDIANRVIMAQETENRIFISLHLNLSTSPKDRGFQIFYGTKNQESKELARSIHEVITESGLCTRVREVKQAPEGVFLQHHITVPCVLAECGFISNSEDYNLLKDPEYRSRLMYTVFCAVTEYLQ